MNIDQRPAGTAHPRHAQPEPLRGHRLWKRWFVVVTVGEFLGFAVPAVVAALTADGPAVLAVVTVAAAGAVEGAVLGWAQATVLRRALPGLCASHWIVATASAAVVAYLIGLTPSTLAGLGVHPPTALLIAVSPVLGIALLASIGTAQWIVLRRTLSRSARWIAVTAGAWTAGLGVFLAFTMPLWHPGQPKLAVAVIGVLGGFLMAATVAAITGHGLRVLLAAGR